MTGSHQNQETEHPIRFSVRLKWLGFILSLLIIFAITLLVVVRKSVESNYRDSFVSQFQIQNSQLQQFQEKRTRTLGNTVAELLRNPRLIAALEADDVEQFYYDLNQLVAGTFRQELDGEQKITPFIRFIKRDEQYLKPPENLRQDRGLQAPFPEQKLEENLLEIYYQMENRDSIQSGVMEFEGQPPHLFRIHIIPVIDFYGKIWGHLFFHFSITQFEGPGASSNIINAIVSDRHLYSMHIPREREGKLMQEIPSITSTNRTGKPVTLTGNPHLAFLQPIQQPSGFPHMAQLVLFSLDEQEAVIASINRSIILIASGFLLLATLLGWVITHFLTAPIDDLMTGIRNIRMGILNKHIPIKTGDELGALAASFNSMTSELELKNRYRAVLDKITDPQVAEQLTTGDLKLGGEERLATVLFCDLRNFTAWNQSISPTEVVTRLNQHMTEMTRVANKWGGVVDKFIGDEIMVLFGCPRSYGNDTEQAVNCALDMIRARSQLNQQYGENLQIGIGVARGDVIAGCMGSEDRLNYTALGTPVNLASRLCGAAGPGECLIDENAYHFRGSVGEFTGSRSIDLKGFSSKVTVFSNLTQT